VDAYNYLLSNAACTVGNSSSFIREGSYLGTPGVIVGNRQNMREHGSNVMFVDSKSEDIVQAIQQQLGQRYSKNTLFGEGLAGARIAEILINEFPSTQKVLHYDKT
jgi:UDP-N-acetylglucosamine 2-epimerase